MGVFSTSYIIEITEVRMEKIVAIALVAALLFAVVLMVIPGVMEWKADREQIEVLWDGVYYLREDPYKGYLLQAEDDPEGERVSWIRSFSDYEAGLAPVHVGSGVQKYGYINEAGVFVIEPVFEYAEDFSEGLACVQKDGQCGYIDLNGEYVVTPQYYTGQDFMDGYAAVAIEGGKIDNSCSSEVDMGIWGLVDAEGRVVIEPQYDALSRVKGYGNIIAEKDERDGLIDVENNILIPFAYEGLWFEETEEGLYIWAKNGREYFRFDTKDATLTPVKMDYDREETDWK